jgi:hypothetical protein
MEMRNAILGTVAGLFMGTVVALAYSHYLGDGSLVADLQAKLDEANADLANLKSAKVQMARQTSGASEEVQDLTSQNDDLRKQLDAAKGAPSAAPAEPPVSINTLAGLMMGMMRGGGGPFQAQQRLFVMQARLKLTPDQAAKIKAAMDADQKARRDLMRQRFQNGGKVDPAAAAAANTLDATLKTVLTYQQQADYQKLQADEKAARAETTATTQVNNVMPLLQLSDSQKQAAMDAIYQVQLNAPDPTSLITDPNPMAAITGQAQATQAVLNKVLSPDQMALYQQEAQAQAQAMASFQGGRRGGNGGGGNNGGGNGGGQQAAAPTAAATTASSSASSTATSTTSTTTLTAPATNADGSPATPAATTNAAPAQ